MIVLYKKELHQKLNTKSDRELIDVIDRRKQVQKEYYKRRGYFNVYKRKIANKTGLDVSKIENVIQLDELCSQYLFTTHGLKVNEKATGILLKCY
jgi:hypothetical protein